MSVSIKWHATGSSQQLRCRVGQAPHYIDQYEACLANPTLMLIRTTSTGTGSMMSKTSSLALGISRSASNA